MQACHTTRCDGGAAAIDLLYVVSVLDNQLALAPCTLAVPPPGAEGSLLLLLLLALQVVGYGVETSEEAEADQGDAGSDDRRKPRNYWIVSTREGRLRV